MHRSKPRSGGPQFPFKSSHNIDVKLKVLVISPVAKNGFSGTHLRRHNVMTQVTVTSHFREQVSGRDRVLRQGSIRGGHEEKYGHSF